MALYTRLGRELVNCIVYAALGVSYDGRELVKEVATSGGYRKNGSEDTERMVAL